MAHGEQDLGEITSLEDRRRQRLDHFSRLVPIVGALTLMSLFSLSVLPRLTHSGAFPSPLPDRPDAIKPAASTLDSSGCIATWPRWKRCFGTGYDIEVPTPFERRGNFFFYTDLQTGKNMSIGAALFTDIRSKDLSSSRFPEDAKPLIEEKLTTGGIVDSVVFSMPPEEQPTSVAGVNWLQMGKHTWEISWVTEFPEHAAVLMYSANSFRSSGR